MATGTKRGHDPDPTDMENFLLDNYVDISNILDVKSVLPYLIQKRALTISDKERILHKVEETDKAGELLDTLLRNGKCTPDIFIDALRQTDQTTLIDMLGPDPRYKKRTAVEQNVPARRPMAPQKLEAVKVTDYSITLQWTPAEEPLVGYLVEKRLSSAGKYDHWKCAHDGLSVISKNNKPQLTVPCFTYEEYDFRVRAMNDVDDQPVYSEPTVLRRVVAKLPDKPFPPRNLLVQSCNCYNGSNCVTLKWLEPKTVPIDVDISYIIEKCCLLDGISGEWETCVEETADCECIIQDQLKVGEMYRFRVFAKNKEKGSRSEATEMDGSEIRIMVDLKQSSRRHFKKGEDLLKTYPDIPKAPFNNMILLKTKEDGSVILVFSCNDLDSVIELWEMYRQGEVHQVMKRLFMSEDLLASGVSPDDLVITINPEDFIASCRHLLLTHHTDKGFRVVRMGSDHSTGQEQRQSQEYPIYNKPLRLKQNPVLEKLDLATTYTNMCSLTTEDEVSQTATKLKDLTLSSPSPEIYMEVVDTQEDNESPAVHDKEDRERLTDITHDQQPPMIPRTETVPNKSSHIVMPSLADKLQELELNLRASQPTIGYGRALINAIVHGDSFIELEVLKSLGDLHLQKAKLLKDAAEFDKAAALYSASLLCCKDPNTKQTLEHRIGYMEKLSIQLLRGYKPKYLLLYPVPSTDNSIIRVAKICIDLERHSHYKDIYSIEKLYTEMFVNAIADDDMLLQQEALKSLGDLYLKNGMETSNLSQLHKATAIYRRALNTCDKVQNVNGTVTLLHRINYTEKMKEEIRKQLSQRTEQESRQSTRRKRRKRKDVNRPEDSDPQYGMDSQYKEHFWQGYLALEKSDLDKAEQHFASALKLVHIRDPTAQQYQREVEPLCKLGDVYSKRGQQTGDGGDFVKAAALYNAAVARSEDQVLNGNIERAITDVEKSFLHCVLNIHSHLSQDNKERHKKQLKEMRDQVKLEMETIDQQLDPYVHDEDDPCVREIEAKRAQAVRQLFEKIAQIRKEFISLLVEECLGLMGPPPCKYALIGLGSQSTGLVTPYSDLEFTILVEEESEECLVYFRNLTHYLHLKVVNLGETILPALGIISLNDLNSNDPHDNWYYDSVTPRGLAFDGSIPWASKTPLGRQGSWKEPPSELICTPENMASKLQGDAAFYLKERYHLATIFRNPCLIAGDQDLIDMYMGITGKILQADGGKMAQQLAQVTMREYGRSYNDQEMVARLMDVKKEIYHFPAVAVDCLALSSGIVPTTIWETIEEMEIQQVISPNNAHHLTVLTSISAELRLRTHLANGGQKENLAALASMKTMLNAQESSLQMIPVHDEVSSNALKPVFNLPNDKQLFRYYYTAVPLKRGLNKWAEERPVADLYDSAPRVKGILYSELCKYRLAIRCYAEALKEDKDSNNDKMTLLRNLGDACLSVGDYEKAISYYIEALQVCRIIYGKSTAHSDITMLLNKIGKTWGDLGNQRKAISYYEQALQMELSFYGHSTVNANIAMSLHNLGLALGDLGDYRKAISYLEQALQMCRKIYGESTPHPDIATSLNNLGHAWSDLGDYRKAISYLEQALKMRRSIYGETTPHPDIATPLNNLGQAWGDLGDYRKAINYYEQALQMCRSIYGQSTPHPKFATSLRNLGQAWDQLGDYRKAISYLEQALQMCRSIYGETTPHPDIATSLNKLGQAWGNLGDNRKAIRFYEQALQMSRSIYGQGTEHPNFTTLLNNLGSAWNNLGDHRKAISYYEQALQMSRSIYGQGATHPNITALLNNLGSAWHNLGDFRKAITYLEQALQMDRDIYGEGTAHTKIAVSLNNLGQAWDDLGDQRKAISYLTQAMQMHRSIYGPTTPHHNIATSLRNLGQAWHHLGDYTKAISYIKQALQMHMIIYGQNTPHPDIATSLNSLGLAWGQLGDYIKAISYYEQALQMCRTIYGESTPHPDIATSLNSLGQAWGQLGDYRKAISYYEQAMKMHRSIYGESTPHPNIATSLNNLGQAWSDLGDYRKAISYLEQALQMYRSIYGESRPHPVIATSLNNLGHTWHHLGSYKNAISYYEQALQMRRSIYGQTKAHPDIATSLNNLGQAWDQLSEHRKAMSYFEQALQMSRSIYGQTKAHLDIVTLLNNLGQAWSDVGDGRKAISYLEQALKMCRTIYGQSTPHPVIATSLSNLGQAWGNLGDNRKAISYYEEALQMCRSIYGQTTAHPGIAVSLNNLSTAWLHLGNYKIALSLCQEALVMAKQIYPHDKTHPIIKQIESNIALIMSTVKESTE